MQRCTHTCAARLTRQLSRHWPGASHTWQVFAPPPTCDWQCKYGGGRSRNVARSHCTTPYGWENWSLLHIYHQNNGPFFKLIVCCFDSEITSSFLCHKQVRTQVPASMQFFFFLFLFFQTQPPAIKMFCMALTVTNVPGDGKRADIVFYGMTFETLLFLWWITVYSERGALGKFL